MRIHRIKNITLHEMRVCVCVGGGMRIQCACEMLTVSVKVRDYDGVLG